VKSAAVILYCFGEKRRGILVSGNLMFAGSLLRGQRLDNTIFTDYGGHDNHLQVKRGLCKRFVHFTEGNA
jgi:hypothetical protein